MFGFLTEIRLLWMLCTVLNVPLIHALEVVDPSSSSIDDLSDKFNILFNIQNMGAVFPPGSDILGRFDPEGFMAHADRPIPEQFDARTQWPQCKSIGRIRDQGVCGCCWAVALSSMMSDRLCISTNGTDQFSFSAEDLVTCCRSCTKNKKLNPCRQPGYFREAMQYFAETGVVSGGDLDSNEGCKPLSNTTMQGLSPPCQDTCTNLNYTMPYSRDKRFGKIVKLRNAFNIRQLQIEIMVNGPVAAGHKYTEHFGNNMTSGVYQHPPEIPLNKKTVTLHVVKIIGWGTENGVPYWLVANSWGRKWGKLEGFFKILRGKNQLSIESYVMAGRSSFIRYLPVNGILPISVGEAFYLMFFSQLLIYFFY